ncbi:MAG TPA: hypothetical protein VGP68_22780, partial [Gemmataceae bacterium]|nr:hypothetical protein [Gemmataceae bacterium]
MIKFWAGAFVILCVLSWRPAVFVAVDDPPTASLAELLMLYQDLGLPLPPKSAKLVRYESRAGGFMNGVRQPPQYSLAFLIEPNGDQKEMALLSGTNLFERWKPPQWRVIGPTATAALETPGFRSDISLAIQCQALGWNELAADILVRSQRNQSDPPKKQIVFHAWNYWTSQMMKPAVDRKPILSMLKKLKAIDPERAAQFKADSVIRSLELALAPSTAKPGSIEALIDQLVEATDEGWPLEEERNSTPYQKLVRLGFDAVPALVVYLDDTRLTCATYSGRVRNASREVLVGDIVGDILKELAGSEAAQEWRTRIVDDSGSREPLVKSDILAWWREAQKIGEEAYLVKHATDLEIDRYARHTLRQPRQNRLEIVAQKYPRNLEKIYR